MNFSLTIYIRRTVGAGQFHSVPKDRQTDRQDTRYTIQDTRYKIQAPARMAVAVGAAAAEPLTAEEAVSAVAVGAGRRSQDQTSAPPNLKRLHDA